MKKVDVAILRTRNEEGLRIDGELRKVGDKVSVDQDVAKSLERHGIAERVKSPPKTPGSPAKSRKTRVVEPEANRIEE